MSRDADYIKLIHAARWVRLRMLKLSQCPLCERCQAEGRVTAAAEVHHIRPVEEALTYADKEQRMYDPDNLRALCHRCHALTHQEMGRNTKDATRRRNDKHVLDIIATFFTPTEPPTPGGIF